jgi:hypothetical protein
MALDTGFVAAVIAVLGLLIGTRIWERRENAAREPLYSEILFALARSEETSEFEQFLRAAAVWRISRQQVEDDFKRYLWQGELPHYMRDHLRRARERDPDLPDRVSRSLTSVLVETRHRGKDKEEGRR